MNPVLLEVVFPVPALYGLCPSCEFFADEADLRAPKNKQDLNEYPEDLKADYLFLSDWIRELAQKYPHRILIKVIDAQSLQGMYKSIRFAVRKYPAFIIDRKKKYAGRNKDELDALIRGHMETPDPT
jgi:hypothetical protein